MSPLTAEPFNRRDAGSFQVPQGRTPNRKPSPLIGAMQRKGEWVRLGDRGSGDISESARFVKGRVSGHLL